MLCEQAALLTREGEVIPFKDNTSCSILPNESYYVVIEHRNHLPVMSHEKITPVNTRIHYDFRKQNSYIRALGFGQKEVDNGRWAMYAGNGDQTESATSPTDLNVKDMGIWLLEDGKNSSYYFRDYDLSGDVNVQDKGLLLRNSGIFTDVKVKE